MKYLCLDIETGDADQASLDLETQFVKPNGNIKDAAKKEQNVKAKTDALRDKAALLDASPIVCLSAKSEAGIMAFCTFPLAMPTQIQLLQAGLLCVTAPDERTMLIRLREFLNRQADAQTELVTFNGKAFDLPRLRFRYARHGLILPDGLQPNRNRHTDLMLLYANYYTIKSSPFIALSEVVQQLGIAEGKVMSGAQIPGMIAAGRYVEIVLYNILDTLLTERIYLTLTAQTGA